jgi:hypothetical protein
MMAPVTIVTLNAIISVEIIVLIRLLVSVFPGKSPQYDSKRLFRDKGSSFSSHFGIDSSCNFIVPFVS